MNFIKTNIFCTFILVLELVVFICNYLARRKGFYGFIALLALGGFCVALYIYYTKKIKEN